MGFHFGDYLFLEILSMVAFICDITVLRLITEVKFLTKAMNIMQCKLCLSPLVRAPRSFIQKLLVSSRCYACRKCGRRYLRFFGLTFKL